MRVFKYPLLHHELFPPSSPAGALLQRAETQFHGAFQVFSHGGQHFCDAHQNGYVGIMTTGVHHRNFLTIEFTFALDAYGGLLDSTQVVRPYQLVIPPRTGGPPFRIPTTPVLAMPVFTSIPIASGA